MSPEEKEKIAWALGRAHARGVSQEYIIAAAAIYKAQISVSGAAPLPLTEWLDGEHYLCPA
jgi:hypothetical protein